MTGCHLELMHGMTTCHSWKWRRIAMPKELFFLIDAEKQRKIQNAAMQEFSSQMYESSSINQIIKQADISRGSFYQYFEDKDDLYFYMISIMVKDTAYRFLKEVVLNEPEDIFAVYQALFAYNLRLLSEPIYQAFFRNLYLSMNYRLQQELKNIFGSIRSELMQGKLLELERNSGFTPKAFQELMNLLELNNRDLLMQFISESMDEATILNLYQTRLQILKGKTDTNGIAGNKKE